MLLHQSGYDFGSASPALLMIAELACKLVAVQADTVLVVRGNLVVLVTAEAKAPCDQHRGSAPWEQLEETAVAQDREHLLKTFVLRDDLL